MKIRKLNFKAIETQWIIIDQLFSICCIYILMSFPGNVQSEKKPINWIKKQHHIQEHGGKLSEQNTK